MTDTTFDTFTKRRIKLNAHYVRNQIEWDLVCRIERTLWAELSLMFAPRDPDTFNGVADEVERRIRDL